jgi:hypothetical protein
MRGPKGHLGAELPALNRQRPTRTQPVSAWQTGPYQILPGARRRSGLANPLMPGETGLTGDEPVGSRSGRDAQGAALPRLDTPG